MNLCIVFTKGTFKASLKHFVAFGISAYDVFTPELGGINTYYFWTQGRKLHK